MPVEHVIYTNGKEDSSYEYRETIYRKNNGERKVAVKNEQ